MIVLQQVCKRQQKLRKVFLRYFSSVSWFYLGFVFLSVPLSKCFTESFMGAIAYAQDSSLDSLPKSDCENKALDRLKFIKQVNKWGLEPQSQALFDQYQGNRLSQVELNCQLKQCHDSIAKSEILRALQVPVYQAISSNNILELWTRLMALGLFETHSFFVINSQAQAIKGNQSIKAQEELKLSICASSPPIIESIRVRYQSSTFYPKQFLSEIYKRLNLKRGGYLPRDNSYLRELESQLIASYKRLGYHGVTVQIIPIFPSKDQQRVTIEIRIREGNRPKLGSPIIEILDQELEQEVIEENTLRIARSITPDLFFDAFEDFFSFFGLGHYDRRATRQRADQLEADLRNEGWVSARVKVIADELYNGKMSPVISIRRGPKLSHFFQGNLTISSEDLEKELTFKESGVIDEIELEASRQNIIKRYKSASYYYVDVKAKIKTLDSKKSEVIFTVDEGPQVYIGELVLRGLPKHIQAEVNAVIDTKGVAANRVISTLRSASGILQEAKLNQDLNKLIQRLQSLGYSQVSIRCSPVQKQALFVQTDRLDSSKRLDIWSTDINRYTCFRVIPDHKERSKRQLLTVLIEVNLGKRTRLNFVDFYPFDQTMDEQTQDERLNLLKGLELIDDLGLPITHAGFSQDKLNLISNFLLSFLKGQGYLRAKIKPYCQKKQGKASLTHEELCDLESLYGEVIERLSFKAELGPKAEVNALIIHGQLLTKEELLRREILLRSGSPLSADAILLSQSNLRGLGLFRSVNIKTIGLGMMPQDALVEPVTLVLNVEENQPWLLDSYLGLRLTDQTITSDQNLNLLYTSALTIRHRNIQGKGWELGGGVSHDNLVLNPTDTEGDNASWAVGPFFKNPRLFDSYAQLFTEFVFEQGLSGQRTSYLQRLRGKGTLSYNFYNLSFPQRWGQGLTFELELEAKLERQRPLSRYSERRAFTEATPSFNIAPTLVYDQRDNPIHPTRGFYLTAGVDFLGSQELFNGVVSYKETLNAQWVGAWFKKQLLFVPSFKFGAVQSQLSDAQLTMSNADFLFTAGGDGVIYPVRGYPAAVINTCTVAKRAQNQCQTVSNEFTPSPSDLVNFSGRAVMNMNVEARFPSFLMNQLWLATFADIGAVSENISQFEAQLFYPSIGAGIRYLLPGQVPLRLDIAYPLRETAFSSQKLAYHFNFFYVL